jgi:CheY-like chemotaxis protein
MLRDGNVQQRHVMRALDTIHRNATAQVQIVNDLLDVSRIVRGSVQIAPRRMSLGPLLTLAVESIAPTAEAKEVSITTSLGSTPLFVWADHDRLQQVFWNLLSNAVKFTSSGGRVEVRMQADGGDVRVDVSDTGNGIAPAFLPHVFERFRQADGSSTRTHGGLGLGLSIGRHLVELHGGRMQASSAGEGQGSTFSVYLPMRETEQRPSPPAPAERRRRARTIELEGAHLLIVDDEPDARELLRVMLVRTGARITEAANAEEALRLYSEDRPDVMLADVAMPGSDGYALIRAIRSLPNGEGGHVLAVAVSAYARREDRERALMAGFNDHLAKPVQPDDLYDVIERLWVHNNTRSLKTDSEPRAKIH